MNSFLAFMAVNGIWILVTIVCCALSVIFAEKIKRIPILGIILDTLQKAIG